MSRRRWWWCVIVRPDTDPPPPHFNPPLLPGLYLSGHFCSVASGDRWAVAPERWPSFSASSAAPAQGHPSSVGSLAVWRLSESLGGLSNRWPPAYPEERISQSLFLPLCMHFMLAPCERATYDEMHDGFQKTLNYRRKKQTRGKEANAGRGRGEGGRDMHQTCTAAPFNAR